MADGTLEVLQIAERVNVIIKEANAHGARDGGSGLADALVVVTAAHAALVDAMRAAGADEPLLLELISTAQKIGLAMRKQSLVKPQGT